MAILMNQPISGFFSLPFISSVHNNSLFWIGYHDHHLCSPPFCLFCRNCNQDETTAQDTAGYSRRNIVQSHAPFSFPISSPAFNFLLTSIMVQRHYFPRTGLAPLLCIHATPFIFRFTPLFFFFRSRSYDTLEALFGGFILFFDILHIFRVVIFIYLSLLYPFFFLFLWLLSL